MKFKFKLNFLSRMSNTYLLENLPGVKISKGFFPLPVYKKKCPGQYLITIFFSLILLKFGLSEKHTKFEKIFLMVGHLLSTHKHKHKEDCEKFCVLLGKSELDETSL